MPAVIFKLNVLRTLPNTAISTLKKEFRDDWDKFNLWRYVSDVKEPALRAYSMASYPEEKEIMLNVRIATPPPGAPDSVPPGIMSS